MSHGNELFWVVSPNITWVYYPGVSILEVKEEFGVRAFNVRRIYEYCVYQLDEGGTQIKFYVERKNQEYPILFNYKELFFPTALQMMRDIFKAENDYQMIRK